jgi:hypothetical protein
VGGKQLKNEKATWARFVRQPRKHKEVPFASITTKSIEFFGILMLEGEGDAFLEKYQKSA